ncbi:uncharacterized protein [Diadema setosum]|uniref:uncharacterized protein n=1 Tax=Diadema setosum TaxID=31175 RepID=UPI003B3AE324
MDMMEKIRQSLNETGNREVVTELILVSAESEAAFFETVVEWMDIAYYGSEVILGVCATIGNTAVVVAVAVTRELHTVPNTYLVSLAISDLCMGVLGIPILMLALNGWPRNYGLCLTLLTVVLLLDLCSIYSLLAHTFNQFYSTCYPLHYPRVSTRNRVVFHLVLAWLVPLSIALVMPLGWNDGYPSMGYCKLIRVVSMDFLAFMFLAGMIPPFFAMCFMYTRIFKAIARQMNQLEKLQTIGQRLQATRASSGEERQEQMGQTNYNNTSVLNRKPKDEGTSNIGKAEENQSMQVNDMALASSSSKCEQADNGCKERIATLPQQSQTQVDVVNVEDKSDAVREVANKSVSQSLSHAEPGRASDPQRPATVVSTTHTDQGTMAKRFQRVRQERRKALFFCFLMIFFFFTWCPIFTMDTLVAFGVFSSINQHVLNLAVLLSHFNSAFNPVIYSRKREFRRVFRRWLAKLPGVNNSVHPENSRMRSLLTVSDSYYAR